MRKNKKYLLLISCESVNAKPCAPVRHKPSQADAAALSARSRARECAATPLAPATDRLARCLVSSGLSTQVACVITEVGEMGGWEGG